MTDDSLRSFMGYHPRFALAYSGGTDSAFLLHSAVEYGADVLPVFAMTPFCTDIEMEEARNLAAAEGLRLTVVNVDTLSDPGIRANGPDRCYLCKRMIFSAVCEAAMAAGYPEVMDGTNASDPEDERPGMRAIRELGVISPLRECGITKDDIRRMSREAGLPTWDRPTNSCLATRVETGTPLSHWILDLVEAAEEKVSDMGFTGFRIRTDGRKGRLQVTRSQYETAESMWQEISRELRPMFTETALDEDTRD
mgnify:CR=1 FL=1